MHTEKKKQKKTKTAALNNLYVHNNHLECRKHVHKIEKSLKHTTYNIHIASMTISLL